jgi:hypothetical protein
MVALRGLLCSDGWHEAWGQITAARQTRRLPAPPATLPMTEAASVAAPARSVRHPPGVAPLRLQDHHHRPPTARRPWKVIPALPPPVPAKL